jgi:hypothetical protein
VSDDRPRRPHRFIRYTATAEAQLGAAIDEYERVYEMVKSLEYLPERQPDNYLAQQLSTPNEDLWLIQLGGMPGRTPSVAFLYTWDDQEVHVIQALIL